MARPRKNPLTIDLICNNCKKTFNVKYKKKNQRFCSKKCSTNNEEIKKKNRDGVKRTFDERYGCHPMQTQKTKDQLKKSILEKYGVEYYSQNSEFNGKIKQTKLKKYGNENFVNVEKRKVTCLKKYGVDCYVKTEDYKKRAKDTCLKKYGVDNPFKLEKNRGGSERVKRGIRNSALARINNSPRFDNFELLEEYNGVINNQRYRFRCKRCDNVGIYVLNNGRPLLCHKCDKMGASLFQKDVYDFLKDILGGEEVIVVNDRTILYPNEIDLYIPSKKLAIECDGVYWHSENGGNKNKMYHIHKTNNCLTKEIRLIHIFETEWFNKKEIVKSVLRSILNVSVKSIHARKCEIRHIDKKISKTFLINNHLQGNDKSSVRLGLFYENELVSVMTFCKSRFDKKVEYEMSRYCNEININVVGGASKLFSFFIKNYQPKSIVSYCDRRYFSGMVYSNIGFNFIQNTDPSYFYIVNDYKNIINRLNFQKHKLPKILKNFDSNLSEWENMKNNNYDRIWDCGHSKWIWSIKKM